MLNVHSTTILRVIVNKTECCKHLRLKRHKFALQGVLKCILIVQICNDVMHYTLANICIILTLMDL